MIENVLITGATGFLGGFVAEEFIRQRMTVLAVQRKEAAEQVSKQLPDGVLPVFLEGTGLEEAFETYRIDGIVHLATKYDRGDAGITPIIEANLALPTRLLDLGRRHGLELFVNTDTFSSRIPTTGPYLQAYHLSKRQLLEWIDSRTWPFKVATMRLQHLYGPRDKNSKFLPWFIERIVRNEGPIDLTLGLQRRDFIYVEDVAEAYSHLIKRHQSLDAVSDIDIGTGQSIPLREMLSLIVRKFMDARYPVPALRFGALAYREGEVMDSRADRRLIDSLGWSPAHTLESGIEKTISYYSRLYRGAETEPMDGGR